MSLLACLKRCHKKNPPKPVPPVVPSPPTPPPNAHVIALVNRSSVVRDADLDKVAAALQTQANDDFAPAYGMQANLVIQPVHYGATPPAKVEQLVVLDDSDTAGALGYHDLTPDGMPLGKVFAKTDLQYGEKWSTTASHELLEMLADPTIDKVATAADGTVYAYEDCDAVENNEYTIGGVAVSDFVLPAWFKSGAKGPYDHLKVLKRPFELAPGGYISIMKPGQGWTQIYGELGAAHHGYASRPRTGSRRERRGIPAAERLRSLA